MVLQAQCTSQLYWHVPAWHSLERLVVGLSSFLLIFGLFIDVFLPSFPFPSPSPLLIQCDGCLEDCVGARGWVAGIASRGSIILTRAGHGGGPWIS